MEWVPTERKTQKDGTKNSTKGMKMSCVSVDGLISGRLEVN